jgi:formylglycine-generating enzyme required for sulfatase activity
VGTADVPEEDLVGGLMRISQNPEVKPARLIEFLTRRAGLLLPRGVGVYTFPHRTFQEYLAACHLTDHDYPDLVAGLARQAPDRWREVALLAGAKAARGTASAVWSLVDALCFQELAPGAEQAGEDAWGALLSGQALVESANLDQVSERNQQKVERVRSHLVCILEDGKLPAVDRAGAGRALATLGDPRPGAMTVEGIEFCYVPPGPFWMGGEEYGDERPVHRNECLDHGYWMARHPVTVAQYRHFVEESDYREPYDRGEPWNLPNHPVVDVTWHDALAFCRWFSKRLERAGLLPSGWEVRLPSEAEWEKAARGGLEIPADPIISTVGAHGRVPQDVPLCGHPHPKGEYPWGDEPDPERANYDDTGIGTTSAVGCFPGGVSPYGVQDLSGNVWEWTRSLWGEDLFEPEFKYPYNPGDGREDLKAGDDVRRVLRGGSFLNSQRGVRCASRSRDNPDGGYDVIGFRVVVAPVPSGL